MSIVQPFLKEINGRLKHRPTACFNLKILEIDNKRSVEVSSRGVSDLVVGERITRSIRVFSSISSYRSDVYWIIRSSGRRSVIINFLFHKWLFSELNKEERILFLDILGSFKKDPMIFSALKARSTGIPKKIIRETLQEVSNFLFNRKPPTNERWNGYKTFTLSISREVIQRRPNEQKYTGWKRHQNDQGSLPSSSREDPFPLEPFDENDIVSLFLQFCRKKQSSKSEFSLYINNFRIGVL